MLRMMVLSPESKRLMWWLKIIGDFDQGLDQEIKVMHGIIRQCMVASNKCDGICQLPPLGKGDA